MSLFLDAQHHREIALGLVTAVVVASESEMLCNEVCDILGSDYFRVFTSTDVIGVEVGNRRRDRKIDGRRACVP